MKTASNLFKALLLGGIIATASSLSPTAQAAAAPLTAAQQTALKTASMASVGTQISALLAGLSGADKETRAKEIVALLAGTPGIKANVLRQAVRAAITEVPTAATTIAVAAAQAAVSGNAADSGVLVRAIASGAGAAAPGQAVAVRDALFAAVPTVSQQAITSGLVAGVAQSSEAPDNREVIIQNVLDTSKSS